MNPIRRVVSNLQTTNAQQSEQFYTHLLGFVKAMDMGWIMTFAAPDDPSTQISVLTTDPSGFHPHLSIEVTDVEATYRQAVMQGYPIVYPLTDEPWGVRRFFVRDPNGVIINVLSHRDTPSTE